jgi:hypothetical protein
MESDSHSTKWTYPAVGNANGDDFETAVDPQEGVVYIGEGQWGAPHRDIFYTGASAKPFVRDAGTFDNFFFVHVTKNETTIQCVKFENVNGVFSVLDNALGTGLPSNAVLWEPANGNTVVLTNPEDVTGTSNEFLSLSKVYPSVSDGKFTIEFGEAINSAKIEVYNSLGKRCFTDKVEQAEESTIFIDAACIGVCYLYIKYDDGLIESHPIIFK